MEGAEGGLGGSKFSQKSVFCELNRLNLILSSRNPWEIIPALWEACQPLSRNSSTKWEEEEEAGPKDTDKPQTTK